MSAQKKRLFLTFVHNEKSKCLIPEGDSGVNPVGPVFRLGDKLSPGEEIPKHGNQSLI